MEDEAGQHAASPLELGCLTWPNKGKLLYQTFLPVLVLIFELITLKKLGLKIMCNTPMAALSYGTTAF